MVFTCASKTVSPHASALPRGPVGTGRLNTGPIKLMGGPCWLEHVSTTSLCELSHILMRAQLLNSALLWGKKPLLGGGQVKWADKPRLLVAGQDDTAGANVLWRCFLS